MSIMTRGIIGMPYTLAMNSEISRRQFYSHAQVLLADHDSAQKHWENESSNVQALTAEVVRLTAEIEALRKDAERLRWLRQYEFDIGSYHGVHEHNAVAWFEHVSDESIDSMIADEAQFAKEAGHE